MNTQRFFQRMAAITAILSAPLAFGNTWLMLLATNFDADAITNPSVVLASGERSADLWPWSMVLDMFGYYLLIVPLGLLLGRWFGARSPGGLTCLAWSYWATVSLARSARRSMQQPCHL